MQLKSLTSSYMLDHYNDGYYVACSEKSEYICVNNCDFILYASDVLFFLSARTRTIVVQMYVHVIERTKTDANYNSVLIGSLYADVDGL